MLSGTRLREVRKNANLTQEQLAKLLNVSKVTVSGYENGIRVPSLKIFNDMLDVLDVEPNYLLGRDTLVCDIFSDYKVKMSKEDIKLLRSIKTNNRVYNKFVREPRRIVEFIDRKLP